jgi:subtilase family serine protease
MRSTASTSPPAQFRAQFAPKAADVARVQRTLQQMGFQVGFTPASGLSVTASGTVAQVKASFGVSQDLYNSRSPRNCLPRYFY